MARVREPAQLQLGYEEVLWAALLCACRVGVGGCPEGDIRATSTRTDEPLVGSSVLRGAGLAAASHDAPAPVESVAYVLRINSSCWRLQLSVVAAGVSSCRC